MKGKESWTAIKKLFIVWKIFIPMKNAKIFSISFASEVLKIIFSYEISSEKENKAIKIEVAICAKRA